MIVVDNVILSDDVAKKPFLCNLKACKGACCIEGDRGATLEVEETAELRNNIDAIKSYADDEGVDVLTNFGPYILHDQREYSTPLIKGGRCAYAKTGKNGLLSCIIEEAYNDGTINFQKPISCHLYPIKITSDGSNFFVNYHRWNICSAACELGDLIKMPLYKFLRLALIRKFGERWYKKLIKTIEG